MDFFVRGFDSGKVISAIKCLVIFNRNGRFV